MNHSNGWTDSGFSCSLPNLVANKDKQSKDQVYIYLLIDFGIKKFRGEKRLCHFKVTRFKDDLLLYW